MNILINYPKYGESGPAFSFELAKGLKENGQNIFAILPKTIPNATGWIEEFSEEKIYWIRSANSKDESKIIRVFELFFVDLISIRLKFKNKIDVSIKPFYSEIGQIVDIMVHSKLRAAICHDPIPHSGAKINRKKYRKFYQKNDKIFVLTKRFIPIVKSEFGFSENNICYFPHGRMSMYHINDKYSSIASQYSRKFHLLFFGRIEKYKGLHVLAEAYRTVKDIYSDVELTILGSGNFNEYIDEYDTLKDVHLINRYIDDNEVGNYFALPHTICVVPYIDATQSGVIPIAYEFGTPVVASNQGGLREQLDDGRLGLLYDNNDPVKLAERILELIRNEKKFQDETEKMLKYRDNISWNNVAKQLIDGLNYKEDNQ